MKKFFVVATVCLTAVFCCGCGEKQTHKMQSVDTAMGTVIQQNIYTTDSGSKDTEEILALLSGLEEQELSRRLDTSEVWKVNDSAGLEEGSMLSSELAEILERCLNVWQQSEGAFDVTLGPVVSLWDIDGWAAGEREGSFSLPEDRLLRDALGRCGSGKIQLKDRRIFLPEGMMLDLGAVGKGIGLDRILDYLEENEEITGAIISVGGSVLTFGEKPDESTWKVGITNPADTSANIGVLSLEGQWCISTSGDYERYVELDGVRYHHIIDPATGYPADSGVSGVTVLAKDGFLSDALSTACFILGPEKGMHLAERYGAEVLFVSRDGRVQMSEGIKKYFHKS